MHSYSKNNKIKIKKIKKIKNTCSHMSLHDPGSLHIHVSPQWSSSQPYLKYAVSFTCVYLFSVVNHTGMVLIILFIHCLYNLSTGVIRTRLACLMDVLWCVYLSARVIWTSFSLMYHNVYTSPQGSPVHDWPGHCWWHLLAGAGGRHHWTNPAVLSGGGCQHVQQHASAWSTSDSWWVAPELHIHCHLVIRNTLDSCGSLCNVNWGFSRFA